MDTFTSLEKELLAAKSQILTLIFRQNMEDQLYEHYFKPKVRNTHKGEKKIQRRKV